MKLYVFFTVKNLYLIYVLLKKSKKKWKYFSILYTFMKNLIKKKIKKLI